MQISAANISFPRPIEPTLPAHPAADPVVAPPDNTSLRRVAALLAMLENKPAVRPEVVARGRALAADASYPPPDILSKLAGLIVSDVK